MTTAAPAADPADEPVTLSPLRQTPTPRAGGRPIVGIRTLQDWTRKGVNGHRLKAARVGHRLFTTPRWFAEFERAVGSDTAGELGRPGRPVPIDGRRRSPTPNEARPTMGSFDGVLAGGAAMLRAVEDARQAVNPASADPLAGPSPADLAEMALAAKRRFGAAVRAGDGDAAVRAVVSRMHADPVFRPATAGARRPGCWRRSRPGPTRRPPARWRRRPSTTSTPATRSTSGSRPGRS